VDVRRIAVTGWKGRLGSELVRRGGIPLKCDVTDPTWLCAALETAHPHLIVHCAAKTDVDGCEQRPGLAAEVNTVGTWNLCRLYNGPIVYLSTDYIFDGRDGPYDEEARPGPLGLYGWSKLGGEVALKARKEKDDLIVRTTVLFDRGSENFVTRVAYALILGNTLTLPADLVGSPTYVPDLARGILDAIEKGVSGTINLVGERLMSRFEMGEYLQARIGKGKVLPGPPTGNAGRPGKAGLIVDKARRLGLYIGDPYRGMDEVVDYALETVGAR